MRLLRKLNNVHFLSLMANGSMTLINMGTVAILYRFLPIADNGSWIFYQSSVLFIDAFRTGLLNTGFVKYYAGATPERRKEVAGSAWYITILLTAFFILLNIPAFFIFRDIQQEGVSIFLKYLAINLIVTMPNLIAVCIAQGDSRFDRLLYIRVLNNGLFLAFLVIILILGKLNLQLLIYINLAAITIANLFVLLSGWSGAQFYAKKTMDCTKELFHFGKYTVGTFISTSLFKITDTAILTFWLGPAALAVYNLGQRLMEVVELPLRSLIATAMPSMSAAYNKGNKTEVISIMKKYTGMITVGLLPVLLVFAIFADIPISLIGGGKYVGTEAANIFRLLMLFALLAPADRFMATAIDVINKPNLNFIKLIFIIMINLICDYAGVRIFKNVYGVAWANLFPVLFAAIVGYFALQKNYIAFSFWDAYKVGFDELKLTIGTFFKKRKTAL